MRRALHDAALALFAERGFDATTVDDIAARAGTSRRTFFRTFASKESVLFEGQSRRLSEFAARLAARRAGEPFADRLARAVDEMVGVYERDRAEVLAVQGVLAGSAALSGVEVGFDVAWERVLAEAIRRGPPRRSARHAALDAGIVVGGLRAALRGWMASGGRTRLGTSAKDVLARLGPVLTAPPSKRVARIPSKRKKP